MTNIIKAGPDSVLKAVQLLENGQVVALPTETVYGLGADACNGKAVAAIFATKQRPEFNPLIAHVSDIKMAKQYVKIDSLSQKLIDIFWPGPLTLVLPLLEKSEIHKLTTAGLDTLALRQPQGIFSEIIQKLGRPIAAPSANQSGRLSPTSAKAVYQSLGDKVPLIIDGGTAKIGVESTIIKVVGDKVYLLRPGGIAAESIEAILGKSLLRLDQRAAIEAPGMLESHYAPKALLRLNAKNIQENEALLAFGKKRIRDFQKAKFMLNLSENGDLSEAASNLFAALQEFDNLGVCKIAVEPIPENGLGEAINDRLLRAAAPRH